MTLLSLPRVRTTTRMTMMTTTTANTTTTSAASKDLFRNLTSISSRLTSSLKESGLSSNFDNLISGVKNFLPADRDLTITKITESIMDPASAAASAIAKTENYLYFDPRSANARGAMPAPSAQRSKAEGMAGGFPGQGGQPGLQASFGMRRQGFSEGIVFMVGGGSMDEYGNLQDWARRTGEGGRGTAGQGNKRRVVYGATEILNAHEFIKEELERLGRELSGS